MKEIKDWVSSGNTLNFKDKTGKTLLHLALQHQQGEVALFLLQQKPDHCWVDDNGESALQTFLKENGMQALSRFFKMRGERLNLAGSEAEDEALKSHTEEASLVEENKALIENKSLVEDKSLAEAKALQEEFDALLEYAKQNNLVDSEYLAINVDRKYWCTVAQELANFKEKSLSSEKSKTESDKAKVELEKSKTDADIASKKESEDQFDDKAKEEYKTKKEKLSTLIYGRSVICKMKKENGELEFEPGMDPNELNLIPETDDERRDRLLWAFKFAVEGEAFERAMGISSEMISEKEKFAYPEVFSFSRAAAQIKSKDEFFLTLLMTHYKKTQKDAIKVSGEKVKPSSSFLDPTSLQG